MLHYSEQGVGILMYEAWSEEWVVYVMKRIEYGIWGMEHGVCST